MGVVSFGKLIEALKGEIASACTKDWVRHYMAKHWLIPTINEALKDGKTVFHVSNIVVAYAQELDVARERLLQRMAELYDKSWGRLKRIFGIATDRNRAALLVYEEGKPRVEVEGEAVGVVRRLVELFCAQEKLPVTEPRDIVMLFGVERKTVYASSDNKTPKREVTLLDFM